METKYLISRNCEQDFDNHEEYSQIVGYCDTKDEAIEAINHLNPHLVYLKDLIRTTREYKNNIIAPKFPLPEWTSSIQYPKWQAGLSELDITQEMRTERNDIKAKKDAEYAHYIAKIRLRSDAIDILYMEYVNSLAVSLETLQTLLDNDKISLVNETKFFSYVKINKL